MENRREEERVRELWLVSPGHKVDLDEILKRVNVRREAVTDISGLWPCSSYTVELTLYMRQVSAPSAYKYQNKRGDGSSISYME